MHSRCSSPIATETPPDSTQGVVATRCSICTCSGFLATPRCYILILPGFGLISHVVSAFAREARVWLDRDGLRHLGGVYRCARHRAHHLGLVGRTIWHSPSACVEWRDPRRLFRGSYDDHRRAHRDEVLASLSGWPRCGVAASSCTSLCSALWALFLFAVGGLTGVVLANSWVRHWPSRHLLCGGPLSLCALDGRGEWPSMPGSMGILYAPHSQRDE